MRRSLSPRAVFHVWGAALVVSLLTRTPRAQAADAAGSATLSAGGAAASSAGGTAPSTGSASEKASAGGRAPSADDALPSAAAAKTAGSPSTAGTAEPVAGDLPMQPPPSNAPWTFASFTSSMTLAFHGGLETDVGYVRYTHESETQRPQSLNDFRGRFVLGPEVTKDLGSGYFFRGAAQFVAWIREQAGNYQINVDDAYVQVGKKGVWDVAAGRFMTWRVYRKGLGYDLYTLEDVGACKDQDNCYVHTYEVSDIFFRDTPEARMGRVAFHAYPTSWSGIEVTGQYGNYGAYNHIGGRLAAGIMLDPISITGAAEYQHVSPSTEPGTTDGTTGEFVPCDRCGIEERRGGGGGAVLKLKPVELGLNGAYQRIEKWLPSGGAFDISGSTRTQSFGGYAELDVGSLAFRRSLIVGAGLNRTEQLWDDDNWEVHSQLAGYLAYPLGFNNAMVKLVLSEADGRHKTPTNDGFNERRDHMYAGRVRVKFDF